MKKEFIKEISKETEMPEKAKRAKKRKYSKPAVVYQAPLEAMAAACTPLGKNPGPCSSNNFS